MKDRFGFLARGLRSHKKTILLITTAVVATLAVSSLISIWLSSISDLEFPSIGTIVFEGVEGYWDIDLTNKTGAEAPYDWGLICPGATSNLTLYLRSISNVDTELRHVETNWTFRNSTDGAVAPPANISQFMYVMWDYDNSTVHPGETRRAILTLHAESSSPFIEFLITNDVIAFSFDMTISTY